MNRSLGISEDLLISGFNVRIHTRGASMLPLINTGDRITISPEKDPVIGDIIVYKSDDQMFCHRLMRVLEKGGVKYYQARGDSFFCLDEPVTSVSCLDNPVTSDQILGRVTKIERENVSLARRILILVHPVLKFSMLNSSVIAFLIKLKALFKEPKPH